MAEIEEADGFTVTIDADWRNLCQYAFILNATHGATEGLEAWPADGDTWGFCFKRRARPYDVWGPPEAQYVHVGSLRLLAEWAVERYPERGFHICEVVRLNGRTHQFRF